jgi:hypothetical protein
MMLHSAGKRLASHQAGVVVCHDHQSLACAASWDVPGVWVPAGLPDCQNCQISNAKARKCQQE